MVVWKLCQRRPQALSRRGIRPVVKLWDDETVDWSAVPVLLLRSLWSYSRPGRFPEFLRFLDRLQAAGAEPSEDLANIRWHVHKQYLLDLLAAGIPTVPTLLVRCAAGCCSSSDRVGWDPAATMRASSAGGRQTWEAVRASAVELGWGVSATEEGCVWKPALGSQGDGVRRVTFPKCAVDDGEPQGKRARLDPSAVVAARATGWPAAPIFVPGTGPPGLLSLWQKDDMAAVDAAAGFVETFDVDMLLQPLLPLVPQLGEICLVFVRGKFVHAVHKDPTGLSTMATRARLLSAGCAIFANRVRSVIPTAAQLAVASAVLAALPGGTPVLARFDLLPRAGEGCSAAAPGIGAGVDWLLSEVEIFGPELFARVHPAVAERVAAEIDLLLPPSSEEPS
jgi:hypothetical protein